jgi:hypothetical protein
MKRSDAQPIFVVGLARTGTKWLSNEICRNPAVISVQDERTGIREANMLQGFGRKFELANDDEYLGLIEFWSTTDFFRRTGVDKRFFYESDRAASPIELFFRLMDEYARRSQKEYWLQKAFSAGAFEVRSKYENCKFIVTERRVLDQVRSSLAPRGKPTWRAITLAVTAYVRDMKILRRFQQLTRCPGVRTNSSPALTPTT